MRRVLAVLAIVCCGLVAYSTSASAAVTGFNPGRIMDDSVMANKTSMNPTQIQQFLDSKVPSCSTYHARTGSSNDPGPPYTCLKDYSENGKSSAQIIYDVGQKYNINPQVLIVLLQKEQGLVTDDWPWPIQYRSATGYGCPDTAPCDAQYYGLTNQLDWAAKMFRAILNNSSTWYTPYVLGDNYIQYSPDGSCGGSVVNIQNRATQALYNYTPYQPNQGALAADWGTAPCGAYGNRNFYLYYTSWFGSTVGSVFAWGLESQAVYLDEAMTKPADITLLAQNTDYYVKIRAQNIGVAPWYKAGDFPVKLGTVSPENRASSFCDQTWSNCSRPASLLEDTVKPGSTGTFAFKIKTPNQTGIHKESFNVVSEGASWMIDIGMHLPLTVKGPTPQWSLESQALFTDTMQPLPIGSNSLAPNTSYVIEIKARNTGNTIWTKSGENPVSIATSSPQDRSSQFYDNSWLSTNRIVRLDEPTIAPGGVGTFRFTIKTPPTYGSYKEYFRPVVDGQAWMNDIGMFIPLDVQSPTPKWSFVSQNTYTSSTQSSSFNPSSTPNNTRFYLSVKARNTGNTTWVNTGPNSTRLATSSPQDRTSQFYDSTWLGSNRVTSLAESSVSPGSIGTFSFWMKSPYKTNGTAHKEYFRPVVDGQAWMNDIGMFIPFTFNSPLYTWEYSSQNTYSDSDRLNQQAPNSLQKNTTYYLQLKAKNTSGSVWKKDEIRLGTSNPQDRVSIFCSTAWVSCNRAGTITENEVDPGSIATFNFPITTPSNPGTYSEYFRPVIEGKSWLTDVGLHWQFTVN